VPEATGVRARAPRTDPAAVDETTAALANAARTHLAALAAEPRPAGGPAEARARAYAAGVLARAGYRVREVPFTYSAAVGCYGAPTVGAASLAVLLAASFLGMRDRPLEAGATLMIGLLTIAAAAGWAARWGVSLLPVMRRDAVNLVAEPPAPAHGDGSPAEPPRVWLVAHLDSKSQPVAMALRVAGVTALAAAWVAALALAGFHGPGWLEPARAVRVWPAIAVLALAGAGPVMLAVVGSRSAGALDNASGVASVLMAAEDLAVSGAIYEDGTPVRRAPVGVLLTSAEELALAGARAWAAEWEDAGHEPGVALNCDGVDDHGTLQLLGDVDAADGLRDAVRNAVTDGRVRRLPPGVLADSVALAQAGWASITLSRGTWRTLARIHTADDTLARLDGRGVPEAAGALARLARLLVAGRAD
jgi:hypothetical protein